MGTHDSLATQTVEKVFKVLVGSSHVCRRLINLNGRGILSVG